MLLTNRYFWGGLGVLLLAAFLVYVLVDSVLMPTYTRHDVTVEVPDVVAQSYEDAAQTLRAQDLDVQREVARYTPGVPQNQVLDQNPRPHEAVKPGRTIYLTINSGEVPMVKVPPVEGLSRREARNRMQNVGLKVEAMRPDSIPHPFENTITRQEPAAGDSLAKGAGVTLWYSTGLGDTYVVVPDVTEMTVDEAQQYLLDRRIRSKIIGAADDEDDVSDEPIVRQSREPGTRVPEGFELRLYLQQQGQGGAPRS